MTVEIKRVHPLAELFPMLSKPELEALADDIKANGLQEPIKVTADGTLVEGRNRLKACEIAKVEPRFDVVNGDVGDLILSANVFRRHLSQGQIAILAVCAERGIDLSANDKRSERPGAEALRAPINYDYRVQAQKRVEKLVSFAVIRTAADIVRWAPDHARTVLATGKGWKEAQEESRRRSKDAHSEETRIAIMQEDSSDLLAQIGEDGITLAEAWRLRESRIRQERETKIRLTGYLVDRVRPLLDKGTNVQELIENYEPEFATRQIGLAELDEAIEHLRAVRSEMKRQGKG